MPNPNAIVGILSRIDPPVEKRGAEMFRSYPDGFTVALEGELTDVAGRAIRTEPLRLYPGERAAGMLEILEELRRMHAPVYLEADPNTRGITRLLIPLVSRVANITEQSGDDVSVMLEMSHARHFLKRANNYFAELLATLREALASGTWLIVSETDDHEIIDARPHPEKDPFGTNAQGSAQARPERPPNFFSRIIRWFCCFFRCVSRSRAKELFDLCAGKTCDPLTVPPPCIPFMYPDDGCWGRASEMCRLMIAAGSHPRKVWIDGNLHVYSRNKPDCNVYWGWHVAPTLCVRTGFFRQADEVIDPSLFNEPVSKATWKGVQGDPGATLTDTSASIFMRPAQTDPTYSQTNFVLSTYRLQLKNRSLTVGPPPYANCP
jgi:hypothetical protein